MTNKDHNKAVLTLAGHFFPHGRCVFELAAYRSANPNGKISLKPLFVERGMMGLMCLDVMIRVM